MLNFNVVSETWNDSFFFFFLNRDTLEPWELFLDCQISAELPDALHWIVFHLNGIITTLFKSTGTKGKKAALLLQLFKFKW